MPRITFRLSQQDLNYIDRICREKDFKRSDVVRFAIWFLRLNKYVGMFKEFKPEQIRDMTYLMLKREAEEEEKKRPTDP